MSGQADDNLSVVIDIVVVVDVVVVVVDAVTL